LLETQQSAATFGSHAADSDTTSTVRLVIRARILPGNPPAPAQPTQLIVNWRAIALATLALLAVIALIIAVVRHHPNRASTDSPAITQTAPPSVVSHAPVTAQAASPTHADAPLDPNTAINEVMPAASHGSLQTIHGTIRVVIRVLVNPDGSVHAATSHIPGPSRYFERVALQAAKKWTFAPTSAQEPRAFLVHFDFTRTGITGGADPLDQAQN
jgi:TonB family protein